MSWFTSIFRTGRNEDTESSSECENDCYEACESGRSAGCSTPGVIKRATCAPTIRAIHGICQRTPTAKTPLRRTSVNTPGKTPCKTPSFKRTESSKTPTTCKTPGKTCNKGTPLQATKTPARNSCPGNSSSARKTPADGLSQTSGSCKNPGIQRRNSVATSVKNPVCGKKTPTRTKSLSDAPGKTPVCGKPSSPDSCGRTPRPSIIHKRLELTDPNPDPVELFHQFNKDYFRGRLHNVSVKWSSRMTQCAGICHFKGKREGCEIVLSVPLLALRTRKDLIETLLHEMIHAYLFIVDGNREREEHGPKFLEYMERINKKAGCNITVYHDYDSEVDFYQAHVWQCNGPCKKFTEEKGIVRRSINRPPGPSDSWWDEHKRVCKGKFVKISEPTWKPSCLL